MTWFGGIYQDPKNFFATMAVDPESLLRVYPEFKVGDAERERWIATRTGAIAGRKVAERFGWKVGDRIPLKATFWRPKDGKSDTFEFDLVGLYEGTTQSVDETQFFFHYKYLMERTGDPGIVGWFTIEVADPDRADQVAEAIDRQFANSPAETKTATEKAFVQSFAKQVGNTGALLGAIAVIVFFVILLIAGNTMAQVGARADQRARRDEDARLHRRARHGARARRVDAAGRARRPDRPRADHAGGARLREDVRDLSADLLRAAARARAGRRPRLAARGRDRRHPGVVGAPALGRRRPQEPLMRAWLNQVVAVTALNLKSVRQRLGSSLVAVAGFAGVVAVFVAVLSIAEGFRRVMESSADTGTAIVLRAGSDTEMSSTLDIELTRIIKDAPGIARGESGAVASAELLVVVNVPKRDTGTDANVPMRGIEPAGYAVRPEITIVEGRKFREGQNEIIVGRAASREFSGLEVGSRMRWGENEWEVVGVFTAGGSVNESEMWADARVLQGAYRRGTSYQSIYARLADPAAFGTFKDALTSDPRLEVDVVRESEFYASQSEVMRSLINRLGNTIALLMAVGATFGALNTMYSAVAIRTREIATLRALGFRGGAVLVSVMVEALLLALTGGIAGGLAAYLVADGYQTATMNFQSFSQVAFSLTVSPELLVGGIVYALAMGFAGGIFPAVNAVRLPVASGLRRL